MALISEESIRKIADANDIVEIIQGYFPLKRAGTSYRALCPFHKEKSPSFHVNPTRQSFHCFGCGAGGGVFRFVMDYEKIDFPSAVRKLAQRAGIPLIEENDPGERERRDQRGLLMELHRMAAEWFHVNLLRNRDAGHARDYLKRRGLTKEIAVAWGIGYAPAGWEALREWAYGKGFTRTELLSGGLLTSREGDSQGGYDRFRDRLMFPIRNDHGAVVAFSGRILNDSQKEAKYVNSPETPVFTKGKVLFGLDRSKRPLIEAGEAIVLEGQIDLISAFEHGITNVVAPQGTAFTPDQARLLKRLVERVVLCFDSDTAGRNAVEKSLPALLSAGVEVRVAVLPTGEDPDSLIRNKGVEAFRECLSGSRDYFDHAVDLAESPEGGGGGPRAKAEAAKKIAGFLQYLPDAALRESMENHVASRLGLSVEALRSSGASGSTGGSQRAEIPEQEEDWVQETRTKVSASTELLCRLALTSREVREWLLGQSSPSAWDLDPELGILKELAPPLSHLDAPTPREILSLIPERYQPMVSSWELEKLPAAPLETVTDAFRNLKLGHLKKLQQEAMLRLRREGLSSEQLLAIQKEILDYQAQITDLIAPASQAPHSSR
jgi:DNA primase